MTRQLSKFFARERNNERGGVLVLMIFVFALIMAIAALAIDASNLYRSQRELQNAADAGVLAGLNSMVREQWDPANTKENNYIVVRAREIARENALASGITPDGDPLVQVTNAGEVTVEIDAEIRLLLAHIVPNFLFGAEQYGNLLELGAVAQGERYARNIALVLDFSNSMKCPAPTKTLPAPSCDCVGERRPEGTPPEGESDFCATEASNQSAPQKYTQLVDTVAEFLEQFDEERDLISVTLYNTVAELVVPTRKDERGFDKEEIVETLSAYVPGGATNLADGLMTAYVDMEYAKNEAKLISPDEQTIYVVLSDGAPTAGRFLFSPAAVTPQLEENKYSQPTGDASGALANSPGDYDYIHYTVHWSAPDGAYEGPSLFLKKSAEIPLGFTSAIPPSGDDSILPLCHRTGGELKLESDPTKFSTFFGGCIKNLGFVMPYAKGGLVYGDTLEPGVRWREQYSNAAIQVARYIQNQGGLVYTIGYGVADTSTASPYQFGNDNLSNPHVQKEVLLAALAGNFKYMSENNHPQFDYNNSQEIDAQFEGQGNFYNFNPIAENPDNKTLSSIFKALAADIKLKALSVN